MPEKLSNDQIRMMLEAKETATKAAKLAGCSSGHARRVRRQHGYNIKHCGYASFYPDGSIVEKANKQNLINQFIY